MASLNAAGLGPYVAGVSPFAQEAADRYRDAEREFRLQLFDLAVTLGLLLITAAALDIVYCRRNAQALFAKYLGGWNFVRVHRLPLLVEGLLALALMAWAWHATASTIDRYRLPGGRPPPPALLALQSWVRR